VTEQELKQQRTELWWTNDRPIRTIEEAQGFLDSVGFCLAYPVRTLPVVPSFFAAYCGTAVNLPDARHVFADPRNSLASELLVRLLRERRAYEINLLPESSLLVSRTFFPFIYALFGDRNPKAAPKTNAHGGKLSPLALRVFEAIQKHGPTTKKQLQEVISRELSSAALDRALNELWSILKIMRIDDRPQEGASWDLLYRWSPDMMTEGSRISFSEAISALLGKYLEAVVAATREEIEQFFSLLASRSKAREAINALLATREISFVLVGERTLIHLTPIALPHQRRSQGSVPQPRRDHG
jgi:23S rRNA pseudouridine2605 synthase